MEIWLSALKAAQQQNIGSKRNASTQSGAAWQRNIGYLQVGDELEMRITNYKLRILFFCRCRYSQFCGNGSAFQAGDFSGVIVRRSATYGYESYCLSGKGGAAN